MKRSCSSGDFACEMSLSYITVTVIYSTLYFPLTIEREETRLSTHFLNYVVMRKVCLITSTSVYCEDAVGATKSLNFTEYLTSEVLVCLPHQTDHILLNLS